MTKQLYSLLILVAAVQNVHAQNKPSIPVKEGKEGAYIFLSNQVIHPRNTAYFFGSAVISKADGNGRFRELAKFKAVESLEAFRKLAGNDAVTFLKRLKKLPDDAAVWTYITTHQKIEDYGMLAMNTGFLEAMGDCFIDREAKSVPANTVLRYKVDFVANQGVSNKPNSVEGTLTTGQKPLIQKPELLTISEEDSSLVVSWKSTVSGSPDAMFGDIYRMKGNIGRYVRVGQAMAQKDEKQQNITYTWHEKTEPNTQYHYFVVPTTLAGLPGPASDTAAGISRSFGNIEQSDLMTAVDTLNGIYLSWAAPKQVNLFAGLVVERSKNNSERFEPLDTLANNATSYVDSKVLPNIMYFYRIRMLSIRNNVLVVSAQASAIHKDEQLFLEAPERFAATAKGSTITLSWKTSQYPDVAGYYVYRATETGEWELVSNMVKDTVFVDSSAHDARMNYKYTVAAVNYNNIKSELASPAFAKLAIAAQPAMPLGVLAAADGGRILLTWKNMSNNDDLVKGYNIYRKKITNASQKGDVELGLEALRRAGFEKITSSPLDEVTYTDLNAGSGIFEYAVTSVDALGNESNAYNSVIVTAASVGYSAPADVSARKTSKGVEVTWGASLQPGVTQYQVFRRAATEKAARQIGTATTSQSSYTDSKVSAGQLYFYSVKVSGGGTVSEASLEKGVRY